MLHSFVYRAHTNGRHLHLFARAFGHHGHIPLSTYLVNSKVGDLVDINLKGNRYGAVQKGLGVPHIVKLYHSKTGVVCNVTPRATYTTEANTTELKFNNWTKQYPKPADAATGEAFFLSQVARHITLNEEMEYPKVYLDKKMDFDDPTRGSQISRQDIDGVFVDDTTSGFKRQIELIEAKLAQNEAKWAQKWAQHDAKWAQHNADLALINAKLAQHDADLTLINAKLAQKWAQNDAKLAQTKAKWAQHDADLALINAKLAQTDAKLTQTNAKVAELDQMVSTMSFDSMVIKVGDLVQSMLQSHEECLKKSIQASKTWQEKHAKQPARWRKLNRRNGFGLLLAVAREGTLKEDFRRRVLVESFTHFLSMVHFEKSITADVLADGVLLFQMERNHTTHKLVTSDEIQSALERFKERFTEPRQLAVLKALKKELDSKASATSS